MRKSLLFAMTALSSCSLMAQDINTGAGASAGAGATSGSAVYYQPVSSQSNKPADFSRRAPFINIPNTQPTAECMKVINAGGTVGGMFGSNAFGLAGGWTVTDQVCRAMMAYLKAAETVNPTAPHAERFLKLTQCQIPAYWKSWEAISMEENDPSLKCPFTEPAEGAIVVKLRRQNDPGVASFVVSDEERMAQNKHNNRQYAAEIDDLMNGSGFLQ